MTAPRVSVIGVNERRPLHFIESAAVMTARENEQFRCLSNQLSAQHTACLIGPRRVNRRLAQLNASDDAFLVHNECGARAVAAFLVEDAVIFDDRALKIAQERERRADIFGEAFIRREAVNTDA